MSGNCIAISGHFCYTAYMITLYIGNKNTLYDTTKKSLSDQVSGMVQFVDQSEQTLDTIGSLGSMTSLFGEKKLYIINNIDTDLLIDIVSVCAYSENYFLVTTDNITAPIKKKTQKITDDIPTDYITLIESKPEKKSESISPFMIANVLPLGDKKKLWTTLITLKNAGYEAENIQGILFWKLKDMYSKTKDPVLQDQIRVHMGGLVHGYHNTRKQGGDMWNMIEKWVLEYKNKA